MSRLLQALGLIREPTWGEPQPLPPEVAEAALEWPVLYQRCEDTSVQYRAAFEALQAHRVKISTLINERIPGASERRYEWDHATGTIRFEQPPTPTAVEAPPSTQPEWAKQMADDFNKQQGTPEARDGSHD